jgi:hypothetical protein
VWDDQTSQKYSPIGTACINTAVLGTAVRGSVIKVLLQRCTEGNGIVFVPRTSVMGTPNVLVTGTYGVTLIVLAGYASHRSSLGQKTKLCTLYWLPRDQTFRTMINSKRYRDIKEFFLPVRVSFVDCSTPFDISVTDTGAYKISVRNCSLKHPDIRYHIPALFV